MWRHLSLRARLSLPMIAMVLGALALGAVAVEILSPEQFAYENQQASRSAKAVATALNAAIAASADPQATLEAFAHSLGNSQSIQFRDPTLDRPRARITANFVPRWFIALLDIPDVSAIYPITINASHAGDIVFAPDLSADVFEKWIGFLAITASGSALMLLAALSAYFTTSSAIRPLGRLQDGLAQLRAGDYDGLIPLAGPPEIRRSCEAANQLAATLKRLSSDNRDLLRRLVSVQDNERRDLAQELHDELGPLLFAIRAKATVLSDMIPDGTEPHSPAHGILDAAEALQLANRRILEGLSPLYVQELGLEQSIATLLQNARSQAPRLELTSKIDPRLDETDIVLAQTIYRVVREGVTNALRHAQASRIDVEATVEGKLIAVDIWDDGIGFPADNVFGRGLSGMRERIRALDGTFELLRKDARTIVRCRLPLQQTVAEPSSSS